MSYLLIVLYCSSLSTWLYGSREYLYLWKYFLVENKSSDKVERKIKFIKRWSLEIEVIVLVGKFSDCWIYSFFGKYIVCIQGNSLSFYQFRLKLKKNFKTFCGLVCYLITALKPCHLVKVRCVVVVHYRFRIMQRTWSAKNLLSLWLDLKKY